MNKSIESLTANDARELLRESMMQLADRIQSDAARIFNDEFDDDDTDYMPARANTLARFIFILTNATDDADYITAMRDIQSNRDNSLDDLQTCDFDLAIDEYFLD